MPMPLIKKDSAVSPTTILPAGMFPIVFQAAAAIALLPRGHSRIKALQFNFSTGHSLTTCGYALANRFAYLAVIEASQVADCPHFVGSLGT
jgi:hypothetical protein